MSCTTMTMIKAAATTTATAMVPQNITFGRASTSAPIHSISSPAERCGCSWVSSGLSSPNGVLTAGSLLMVGPFCAGSHEEEPMVTNSHRAARRQSPARRASASVP